MEIFYDNQLAADATTERSLAVLSENSVSIIVNRCTSCLKRLPFKKNTLIVTEPQSQATFKADLDVAWIGS